MSVGYPSIIFQISIFQKKMAQRYVLSNLKLNLTNRGENSQLAQNSMISNTSSNTPRKDMQASLHSLSRTRSPTKLASKTAKDPNRTVPFDKYQDLANQFNQLVKANKVLKTEREQFLHGYQELKFISEREKSQLCQAFQQLKKSYVELQNKYQSQQKSIMDSDKGTTISAIAKLNSEIDGPLQSEIKSLKEQNQNIRSLAEELRRQLQVTTDSLEKCLDQKDELSKELEASRQILKEVEAESNKSEQCLRQEIHQMTLDHSRIGLFSNVTPKSKPTKVSILMDDNRNLVTWKQNLEDLHIKQKQALTIHIASLEQAQNSLKQDLETKDKTIQEMEQYIETITAETEKATQLSRVMEKEVEKAKAEIKEVKHKASEEYKEKISLLLDKAFSTTA